LIEQAIRDAGHGGDIGPVMTGYLSATSRLLRQRLGAMPGHLLYLAQSGAGKSWNLAMVKTTLPPEAYVVFDASSPRVMIYDHRPLRQRVLLATEADSIPKDPENPATSAIRNLLQDGYLHYSVVTPLPGGGHYVNHIARPGPTTFITCATRKLDEQMMTRFFIADV